MDDEVKPKKKNKVGWFEGGSWWQRRRVQEEEEEEGRKQIYIYIYTRTKIYFLRQSPVVIVLVLSAAILVIHLDDWPR